MTVRYADVDGERRDISISRNVSQGGITFHTDRAYDPDTVLSLWIHVPGRSTPVKLYVNVVDSRRGKGPSIYVTRVKFIIHDDQERQEIENILTQLGRLYENIEHQA